MKNHPYTSSIFIKTWLSHFISEGSEVKFDAIEGPVFIKKKIPPIYINSGSNLTLQAFYKVINSTFNSLKKKVLVIYDVPNYFKIENTLKSDFLKIIIVKEYIGFLIDLSNYKSLNEYLNYKFNSKKRGQFRSYIKKLENSFNISYQMFYGEINREEYEYLFNEMHSLLVKSFSYKKIKNRKLIPENFAFLKEVTYKLILEKQACLFVIYNDKIPIGISMNYNADGILFGDSTVYDLNYSKFNIGIIGLMKQIEWCISNQINIYDFSKGYFPYKKRWCNKEYHFEHHVIYDSKSLKSNTTAFLYSNFLKLKQYLREHPFRTFLKERVFIKKKVRKVINDSN